MSVVILSSNTGWHIDELTRAVRARGLEPLVLPWEANVSHIGAGGLTNQHRLLADSRAILPRIIPGGSLEQIIFRVDTLHRLEEEGARVMNSARAIERTVDKAWTSAILARAGLPTPATIVCEQPEAAFEAWRTLGGDVVVKPLFGSMGLGMSRVSDEDMAWRVFRVIETVRGVYYLQRFIPHEGRDIRAFVVGGKVLGAMQRTAPGWRTNFSRGGKAAPIEISPAWADLALRAAAEVGAEYAGVDLLPGADGKVYVLEVNGIPGWEGLQQATGIDVAGAVIDQLLAPAA